MYFGRPGFWMRWFAYQGAFVLQDAERAGRKAFFRRSTPLPLRLLKLVLVVLPWNAALYSGAIWLSLRLLGQFHAGFALLAALVFAAVAVLRAGNHIAEAFCPDRG